MEAREVRFNACDAANDERPEKRKRHAPRPASLRVAVHSIEPRVRERLACAASVIRPLTLKQDRDGMLCVRVCLAIAALSSLPLPF